MLISKIAEIKKGTAMKTAPMGKEVQRPSM